MSRLKLGELDHINAVNTVLYEQAMTSTSDLAKQKLTAKGTIPPLPMLVICDRQTSGRGQPGKSWSSDQSSLTFTWCDSKKNIRTNDSLLPLIVGASVCEALELLEIPNAKLKWPNDVMLDQRKVCGILVEKIPVDDDSVFLIGIGINLNQNEADLKKLAIESNRFQPGSLRIAARKIVDAQTVLETVLARLDENVRTSADWVSRIEARMLFLNERIEFARPNSNPNPNGEMVTGELLGIDADGQIRIQTESEVATLASGQIL